MRAMVVGQGAEDARHPVWAHVCRSLIWHVDDVFAFDHVLAAESGTRPEYQRAWVVERMKPDLMLTLGTHPELDDFMAGVAADNKVKHVKLKVPGLSLYGEEGAIEVPTATFNPHFFGPGSPNAKGVVAVADATPERAAVLSSLLRDGIRFDVFGKGWDDYVELARFAHGDETYERLAGFYRDAAVALVFADADGEPAGLSTLRAIEAAASSTAVVSVGELPSSPLTADDYIAVDGVDGLRSALASAEERALDEDGLRGIAQKVTKGASWQRIWTAGFDLPIKSGVTVTKDGPAFTIFTGAYNVEEYIGAVIESTLDQTFEDFELLVCNDGTPDNGRAVVQKYLGDPRVKLIDQPNIGQTKRFDLIWRTLVREGRGEFLTGVGGDDIFQPQRLQRVYDTFQQDPGTDIVHSGATAIDSEGGEMGPVFALPVSYDTTSFGRHQMFVNMVAHPTVVHRRELWDRVGELEEGFAADYHYWLKTGTRCRYRYLPENLLSYRIHEKGASTGSTGVITASFEGKRVRAVERGRYSIEDLYPLLRYTDDPVAVAAAFIDMGNGVLATAPDLALQEYERAIKLHPPVAEVLQISMNQARKFIDEDIDASGRRDIKTVIPQSISTVPFDIPEWMKPDVITWDGRSRAIERILLVIDWTRPSKVIPMLAAYFEVFAAGDPVELIVPTNGRTQDDVLKQLIPLLPAGIDFDKAPDITLETIDNIAYLSNVLDHYALAIPIGSPTLGDPKSVRHEMQTLRRRIVERQK